ncbi:phosphate signaling complex protein PhoU [Clostridium collagenovorans]|uniref:phosphate signaling complex protein PhoU n=1 Tax=Clostridium collagenovorans TaxID=29357 RepID=UPI003BFA6DA7
MSVRDSFENSMKELQNDLKTMGNMVEQQLDRAVKSLLNEDCDLAEKVIKEDDEIDALEKEVENKAIILIATQQPLATDLRKIFTISKIVTDLERIADHCVSIARITQRLDNEKEYIRHLKEISDMKNIISYMIKGSIESYIHADKDKAYEVCKTDDSLDELYMSLHSLILNDMKDEKVLIENGTKLLFMLKFLERIGDHLTNICEWTIYLVTGHQVSLND